MSTWKYSPLTLIAYSEDNSKISKVTTVDSIDAIFIETFADRLRLKFNPDSTSNTDWYNIPAVFYNENDRLKSLKTNPILIITPLKKLEDENYSHNDFTKLPKPIPNRTDLTDWYINYSAVYYKCSYRVQGHNDIWEWHQRLFTAVKEQVFPKVNGHRTFIASANGTALNKRYIYIVDENTIEDFDKGTFQFDVTFEFTIGLFVAEWIEAYGIDKATFKSCSGLSSGPPCICTTIPMSKEEADARYDEITKFFNLTDRDFNPILNPNL